MDDCPCGEDAVATRIDSDNPTRTRILIAVSEYERTHFLPSFDPDQYQGVTFSTYDSAASEPDSWRAAIEQFQPEILISCWSTPPLPLDWLRQDGCPLRYVSHITGSIRKIVPRLFLERGGLVTNWGGIAAPMVAEHALLLCLASLRNLPMWRPFLSRPVQDRHSEQLDTRSLYGRPIGIHGFGQVARSLAELLKPFRPTLSAFSQGVPDEFMQAQGVTPCRTLEELFSRNEIVFECEALTEATCKSVNEHILSLLPDRAVFVNVGRGLVVDEEALIREASSGRISLATDVAAHEPLTAHSPLCQIPGVVLSPHIGGPTVDHYPDCGDMAMRNVSCYLRRSALSSIVSLDIYDRST